MAIRLRIKIVTILTLLLVVVPLILFFALLTNLVVFDENVESTFFVAVMITLPFGILVLFYDILLIVQVVRHKDISEII